MKSKIFLIILYNIYI